MSWLVSSDLSRLSIAATLLIASWSSANELQLPDIVTRTERVQKADGCNGRATLVRIGIDRNGNHALDPDEVHEPPMAFCSAGVFTVQVKNAAPNAYCSRPNKVVSIRHGKEQVRSEIVVC